MSLVFDKPNKIIKNLALNIEEKETLYCPNITKKTNNKKNR